MYYTYLHIHNTPLPYTHIYRHIYTYVHIYIQICTYPTHPQHTHTQLGIQKEMVIGEVEALLSEFQPLGYLNPKGLPDDGLPPEQIELQYVSYQIGNTQKLLRALGIFFVFIKLEFFECFE